MSTENLITTFMKKAKPYFLMVRLQIGSAGMYIVRMATLNHGMYRYILIVYRNAIAALVLAPFALLLERKIRPKRTFSVFLQIITLGILEPILDHLYGNEIHISIIRICYHEWCSLSHHCLVLFLCLQSITIKKYDAELSLSSLICLSGALQSLAIALIVERQPNGWAVGWDSRLFTPLYTGIVCSGIAYHFQGPVLKERGPVFVAAFNPLCMIMVAVLGSAILGEQLHLGSIIGGIIIAIGLHSVVGGGGGWCFKSKDYPVPSQSPDAQEIPITTVSASNSNQQSTK
ncbi:hypothetical protein SLA2020_208080 [Shorea laevis]